MDEFTSYKSGIGTRKAIERVFNGSAFGVRWRYAGKDAHGYEPIYMAMRSLKDDSKVQVTTLQHDDTQYVPTGDRQYSNIIDLVAEEGISGKYEYYIEIVK